MKKIVIAGGTGFIGKNLTNFFLAKGYFVIILTREILNSNIENLKYLNWDGNSIDSWVDELNNSEAIINLSGKSIDCRHNEKNKISILKSRINSTKTIGNAIKRLNNPPKVWINASAISIYEPSTTEPNKIISDISKASFMQKTALEWEKAFFDFEFEHTKKLALRISLVLSNEDGVLPVLTKNSKMLLGGKQGNGNQKIAWIHIDDLISIIDYSIKNEISGIIDCVSPESTDNKNFNKSLNKALGIKFGINTPTILLKFACMLIGKEASLVLDSNFVIPKRLIDLKYEFKYPTLLLALENLINKKGSH